MRRFEARLLLCHAHRALTLAAALALASACAIAPSPPPEAFAFAPISQAEREMQTRVFATDDGAAVLAACITVLQRHGFVPEDQDHALGVIVAVKDGEYAGDRTRLRARSSPSPRASSASKRPCASLSSASLGTSAAARPNAKRSARPPSTRASSKKSARRSRGPSRAPNDHRPLHRRARTRPARKLARASRRAP
jgi:hypothetical protein